MKILEDIAILGIENPYLSETTKDYIKKLLANMRIKDWNECYFFVEKIAGSLHNARYGSILEAMANHHSYLGFGIGSEEENQTSFERELAEIKSNFQVRKICFAEQGFLGFVFHKRYATMLQIGESNRELSKDPTGTIPFFKNRINRVWEGRVFFAPGGFYIEVLEPGILGKEFADVLDKYTYPI